MRSPRKDIEDIERFEEIVEIVFRQGFGFALDRMDLENHVPLAKKVSRHKKQPGPERLRETFEQLGTTFIKFGQILAQRPDIVPERYTEELEKLEDDVPSFDSKKAMEIIKGEVGRDRFDYIQEKPIAAASIAQVHRARLSSGEEVVVKIRRPGIKETVEKDLEILEFLAKRAESKVNKLNEIKAHKLVEEFSSWTRNELDLKKEARNADILRKNLEDEEGVKIPEVYQELTTERVLVMEYIDGIKCDQPEKMRQIDADREEIAKTASRAGLKQVIRDGFFHADPHPSNFLLQQDGTLVYLDFGMMGRFSPEMQDKMGLLLLHAVNENIDAAVDTVEEIATVEEDADREGLKKDIEEKLLMVRNSTLEEYSISRELLDITVRAADRGYHMPTSFAIVGKSLVTVEGIGLTIYPDFRIGDEYREIAEKILLEKNDPEKIIQSAVIDLIENKQFFERPVSSLKKLLEPHREVIREGHRKKHLNILAASLFISSAIIISQSLGNISLAIIGLSQLLVAILILAKIAVE